MKTHDDYIRLAMEEAEKAVREGNAPFGVVVVDKNGKVIWKDHDRVKERMDPTAYTTSEPCPTCLTSCIKAQVSAVYYGADTERTASLPIKAKDLAKKSKKYTIKVIGGILEKECLVQRELLFKK